MTQEKIIESLKILSKRYVESEVDAPVQKYAGMREADAYRLLMLCYTLNFVDK